MKDLKYWLNPTHGIELNPGFQAGTRDNENGILFYAEYLLLKGIDKQDFRQFSDIVEALQVRGYPGLYDRGAGESLHKNPYNLRTISHDNLTAIAVISNLGELPYAHDIAKHGLKNFMRFDNAFPESPRWSRIQHPRDYFTWLWCGKYKLLSYPFYPIYFISNLVTTMTEYEETSGKLMAWVRMTGMKNSWLAKINYYLFKKLMVKKYGENWLAIIIDIYFRHPDHPIKSVVPRV